MRESFQTVYGNKISFRIHFESMSQTRLLSWFFTHGQLKSMSQTRHLSWFFTHGQLKKINMMKFETLKQFISVKTGQLEEQRTLETSTVLFEDFRQLNFRQILFRSWPV